MISQINNFGSPLQLNINKIEKKTDKDIIDINREVKEQSNNVQKKEIISKDVKISEEYQSIIKRLFTKDQKKFDADDKLKEDLFKLLPIKKLHEEILKVEFKSTLVQLIYVFLGLKPVLLGESLFLYLTDDLEKIIEKLQELNPYFSVDFDKDIVTNEKPIDDFDPKRFLTKLPSATLKDSILACWKDNSVESDAYKSYLYGYGPTFHVFVRKEQVSLNALIFPFSDEHYKQLGEALICTSEKQKRSLCLTDETCIKFGKQFSINELGTSKKVPYCQIELMKENKEIYDEMYKLHMGFLIDEHTSKTDYLRWSFIFRERVLELFDIPYYKVKRY